MKKLQMLSQKLIELLLDMIKVVNLDETIADPPLDGMVVLPGRMFTSLARLSE